MQQVMNLHGISGRKAGRAMWNLLAKLLPILPSLFDSFLSTKKHEYRARAEYIEAQAFAAGRLSPRYILGYVLSFLFGMFGCAVLFDAIFPGILPGAPLSMFNSFISTSWTWISVILMGAEE